MNQNVVNVVGGNLFSLAARYLNDATQWIRIAQANGLSDPVLVGPNTLIIPNLDALAEGGIANQ